MSGTVLQSGKVGPGNLAVWDGNGVIIDGGPVPGGSGGPFLSLSGGTMLGPITLAANATQPQQAVPLQQLTTVTSAFLPLNGGVMLGPLTLSGDATQSLQPVTLEQMNAATGGGPFLPLVGGTLSGPTILTTNTRLGFDTAALGGVPNMYMYSDGGSFVFYADGWDIWTPSAFRGINFKVFGNGGADEYWGATGGPDGTGATLKVYSVSGGFPVIGSILASNEGQLYLGNDNGTILNLQGPTGALATNGVLITAAGAGGSPNIKAVGEAGVDLALTSANYGSVVLGNSNGPTAVISDASQATGHPRTAYFVLTAPTGITGAAIALSTGGITSPPASVSLSIAAWGGGGVSLGNSDGPIAVFNDAGAGLARNAYLVFKGGSSGVTPSISISTGGVLTPPTAVPLGLSAVGNASVVMGNNNGPSIVAGDGGGLSVPRTTYLVFSAGVAGVSPILALSTAGVSAPPASDSLFMGAVGAGGFVLQNDNGRLLTVADGQPVSTPELSYFRLTTETASSAPTIGLTGVSGSDHAINISSLGTGEVAFTTGGGKQARVLNATAAVATVDIVGCPSGGSPQVRASGGNLMLGNGGGIVTTATGGMVQIPTCAGTPTGVPTNTTAGATLIYDTTANKLWAYNGSWRSGTFT